MLWCATVCCGVLLNRAGFQQCFEAWCLDRSFKCVLCFVRPVLPNCCCSSFPVVLTLHLPHALLLPCSCLPSFSHHTHTRTLPASLPPT